eukprot:8100322-Alexandrium_andersonii.AAC.1
MCIRDSKGRGQRVELESVEGELRPALAQATAERDVLSKLKERNVQELSSARLALQTAQQEAEKNLR